MKHTIKPVLASCLLCSISCAAFASNYSVARHTINGGGGTGSSARYSFTASVGQAVAGYVTGTNLRHAIGFWLDEGQNLRALKSIDEAKSLADGTAISISGMVATSSSDDFNGFFYIEEPNRSSGIRVVPVAGVIAGLVRNRIVSVTGVMGTTAAGERQIIDASIAAGEMSSAVVPVGMSNRSLGGGNFASPPLGQLGVSGGQGVNNVGLLVTVWGLISEKTANYIVVDDGSGAPVRVNTSGIASVPNANSYVSVVGISSIYEDAQGRQRLILPRDGSDINTYRP